MIVSALFRTASTHFCCDLAQKLDLVFLDEIYDPLNEDILRMKKLNHEFRPVLKSLNTRRFTDMEQKIILWKNHSEYVVNNHNYDVPWFEAATFFYCRKDLLGALNSMHDLIVRSGQPSENIWIYADWMRRFVEYILIARNNRPIVLAENCGYQFRSSSTAASDLVKSVYQKKISSELEQSFAQLITTQDYNLEEIVSHVKARN